MEQWNISKTKLVLHKAGNILSDVVISGHNCDKCFYKLPQDDLTVYLNF